MKLVEKTFFKGGCYSFLIALALLVISHAMGIDEYGNYSIVLNLKLYLVCMACGFAIAIVGLIFETGLDPIFKRLIHFIVLLGGFIAIFATSSSGSQSVARKILVGIIIFTLCYVVLFLLIFGLKKLASYIEKKRGTANNTANTKSSKYTPRYKQ